MDKPYDYDCFFVQCNGLDIGFFHSLFHYITPLFTKDADIVIINLIDVSIKLNIFDTDIGNELQLQYI